MLSTHRGSLQGVITGRLRQLASPQRNGSVNTRIAGRLYPAQRSKSTSARTLRLDLEFRSARKYRLRSARPQVLFSE